MAGRGPVPKKERVRANEPGRGDWQPTEGIGWQHGEIPRPPTGLLKTSRDTWRTWFSAWFAAHWGPEDLPLLRQVIRMYDHVERMVDAGLPVKTSDRAELRQLLDSFGVTKKGQQDRRWTPPKVDAPAPPSAGAPTPEDPGNPYAGLRLVRPA